MPGLSTGKPTLIETAPRGRSLRIIRALALRACLTGFEHVHIMQMHYAGAAPQTWLSGGP